MNRSYSCLPLLGLALSGVVLAQSTGGFSPSSSGAAAAGGSPVGMVLPYTVQSGSTAPTLPGHAIKSSERGSSESWAGTEPKVPVARAPSRNESARTTPRGPETGNRHLSRNDMPSFNGISFEDGVTPSNREELASTSAARPARP